MIEDNDSGSWSLLRLNPEGSVDKAVLRSLFETARRQGKKPHTFLLDLFTKDTAQAQAALYRKPLDVSIARPILRC